MTRLGHPHALLVVALSVTACGGAPTHPAAALVDITPISFASGMAGGVRAADAPDAWLVGGLLEVEARDDVRGLGIRELVLLDDAGTVVDRADGSVELRVVPAGSDGTSDSQYAMAMFDGALSPGQRVRLRVFGQVHGETGATHYRVVLAIEGAADIVVEGALGVWMTV